MKKTIIKFLAFFLIMLVNSCKTNDECLNCFSPENGTKKVKIGKTEILFKYWKGDKKKL